MVDRKEWASPVLVMAGLPFYFVNLLDNPTTTQSLQQVAHTISGGGSGTIQAYYAHWLLHMAQVEPFEVVLDPCAGIGTIPVEADAYRKSCIGLGGDSVLNHPTIASAAGALEQAAHKGPLASSLLTAWDAAHVPIRTSSVDAVVLDLPFKQKYISENALNQLLPLIFLECARVLVPGQGRIVLLSGSITATTKALDDCQSYWMQPCCMVTPVTIGGLLAWIVRVERSQVPYTIPVSTLVDYSECEN
jgi:hypothetical protein